MEITSYEVLGQLPDLFTFDDGKPVKNLADWELRRKELMETAVRLQYGDILPEPEFLEVAPLCVPNKAGRMNIWRITTGTRAKPISFTMYAHIPAGDGPYPVVVDGDMCYKCMQDPAISQLFMDHGIMLVKFNRCEIVPDMRNPSRIGNLYETYADLTFGALMAWAWGYLRVMDALEQLGLVDKSCVAYTGLSRGGKSALLAGVLDSRATIINPEAPGAGSTSCYRIHMKALTEAGIEKPSETLKDIINRFPDWFNPAMKQYEDAEETLPFDSHSLKALVAPRVLFNSEAISDIWAGPINTWQTSMAAREAWKLYGKPENVLLYWRKGGHDHTFEDFEMLVNLMDHERLGTPLSERFMQLPFDPPAPIYSWKCPE